MKKEINHRPYILIGCLMWIISFFGEVSKLQPFSSIGIIISPIITIFGIFHWFRFYKRTRGHYPKFLKTFGMMQGEMRKNPFAGFGFMFRYVLEFWTCAILFWMGLMVLMILTFGQSDAFEASKEYCVNKHEIIEKVGKIKYYGLQVGGSISTNGKNGSASLSFTIISENGKFSANSEVIKRNDKWIVVDMKIE